MNKAMMHQFVHYLKKVSHVQIRHMFIIITTPKPNLEYGTGHPNNGRHCLKHWTQIINAVHGLTYMYTWEVWNETMNNLKKKKRIKVINDAVSSETQTSLASAWTEITVPLNSFIQYSITEDELVKLQPEQSNKN